MKLKNILLGLACAAMATSCADLNYREYTVYEKDHVFTDFGRTQAFVTNIYSYLDEDMPSAGALCAATDEAEYAWSWASVHDYNNGAWSPTNPKSQWGIYRGIRAVNYFLKESQNADYSELAQDRNYEAEMKRFRRYEYEVRFLRAYFYFNLVRAYGDVPFTTEVLTDVEANRLHRTPYNEVFDFIVNECDQIDRKSVV